jgi:hypothetical protein
MRRESRPSTELSPHLNDLQKRGTLKTNNMIPRSSLMYYRNEYGEADTGREVWQY